MKNILFIHRCLPKCSQRRCVDFSVSRIAVKYAQSLIIVKYRGGLTADRKRLRKKRIFSLLIFNIYSKLRSLP